MDFRPVLHARRPLARLLVASIAALLFACARTEHTQSGVATKGDSAVAVDPVVVKKELAEFREDAREHLDTLKEIKSLIRARINTLDPRNEGEIQKLKNIMHLLTETDQAIQQLVLKRDSFDTPLPPASEQVVAANRKRELDKIKKRMAEGLQQADKVLKK
jgi:gas vesicle protein